MLCTSWWETPTSLKEKRTKKKKQQHRVLSSFFLRMYVNACKEDGDRRPCTNVVNLFVNKCSPCLPLHPAHLDAKRRRRRRRKRSETFLPSSCLEAAPSKLTLTLPHHSLIVRLKTTHPIYTYLFVCVVWWWCWCEETVWWVLAKQPAARLVLYYLRLFKKLFKSRFSNFIAHFRRVNISSSLHATTRTLLQLLTLFRGDWIFHFFTEKCIKTSLPFHHKITWCKFSTFFLSQADF